MRLLYYSLLTASQSEFIADEFVNTTKKGCYIEQERIVC